MIPSSFVFGGLLTSTRTGDWLLGFLAFSILLLALKWANAGKSLAWILAIAFALRFLVGISLYVYLPIHGHDSEDDQAGYVFTDAHRRDDQAWALASSDRPILDAFSKKFASDQYGGLLAFSAWVYRCLSPDAHRPLILIALSAFFAALGIPFLWRAANKIFGKKVAFASAWIFALYPESILLGGSAMREPYLLTFSALALWGFVEWHSSSGLDTSETNTRSTRRVSRNAWIWLALGLLGMMLISPPIAIVTLIAFAGWVFFMNERRSLSWKTILLFAVVFTLGLLFLSASLNRSGEFDSTSPLSVINDWLKLAVNWNAYKLEEGSGWVQKIFDEGPKVIRLPFTVIYGIFQPVLPAALVAPTMPIWKAIYILRSVGWYALLPTLILSFGAAAGQGSSKTRNLILWLSLLAWTWILLAALRGGGDAWDNPRYRTILFVWESLVAGYVWVWWKDTRNLWGKRVLACELVFLLVFTQWYASRYLYLGGQLPFGIMVTLIVGLWGIILGAGWWLDKKSA